MKVDMQKKEKFQGILTTPRTYWANEISNKGFRIFSTAKSDISNSIRTGISSQILDEYNKELMPVEKSINNSAIKLIECTKAKQPIILPDTRTKKIYKTTLREFMACYKNKGAKKNIWFIHIIYITVIHLF